MVVRRELTPAELAIKEHVMDIDDIARVLKISRQTALKRLRAGEIPGTKRGREWFAHVDDLVGYMTGAEFGENTDEEPDDLIPLADEDVLEMMGIEGDAEDAIAAIEEGELNIDVYTDTDGDWLVSEEEVIELAESLEDNDSSDDEDDWDDEEDSDEDDDWREDDEDED